MNKSAMTCASLLLVCLWLTSAARATIVDANEEWGGTLGPGESFTCIAHYIPDTPDIPEGLIFEQAPDWTGTYWFNWEAAGWDTALADEGKTAYLYGPRLTNDTSNAVDVFSFELFYQWDDAVEGFDPNWPVYQDVAIFDDLTLTADYGWKGTPGGTWHEPNEVTYMQQYYPESDPYENPIPEPVTICLLGLGTALLIKKRRRKTLSLYKLQ